MCSFTCVSVVACVARKLRLCPSYSRRRDRINLGLWRSLYKGGGVPLSRRKMMTVFVANCVATVLVIYLSVALAT